MDTLYRLQIHKILKRDLHLTIYSHERDGTHCFSILAFSHYMTYPSDRITKYPLKVSHRLGTSVAPLYIEVDTEEEANELMELVKSFIPIQTLRKGKYHYTNPTLESQPHNTKEEWENYLNNQQGERNAHPTLHV
jgi:hypothetical protein